MGVHRTCREPNEIELTATRGALDGYLCIAEGLSLYNAATL